ncbi:polysaccharide lyase family 7 protein [Thalassomonas sp. M1454]|nr:polysaccharide lyase family 7 protein [Thalassomonas sp. M1454]
MSAEDDVLFVTIIRKGKLDITKHYDMKYSGYRAGNHYIYFITGVYNLNNDVADADNMQTTFYHIQHMYKGYKF